MNVELVDCVLEIENGTIVRGGRDNPPSMLSFFRAVYFDGKLQEGAVDREAREKGVDWTILFQRAAEEIASGSTDLTTIEGECLFANLVPTVWSIPHGWNTDLYEPRGKMSDKVKLRLFEEMDKIIEFPHGSVIYEKFGNEVFLTVAKRVAKCKNFAQYVQVLMGIQIELYRVYVQRNIKTFEKGEKQATQRIKYSSINSGKSNKVLKA